MKREEADITTVALPDGTLLAHSIIDTVMRVDLPNAALRGGCLRRRLEPPDRREHRDALDPRTNGSRRT